MVAGYLTTEERRDNFRGILCCSETLMGFETPQMTSHMVASTFHVKNINLLLRQPFSAFLPYEIIRFCVSACYCVSSVRGLRRSRLALFTKFTGKNRTGEYDSVFSQSQDSIIHHCTGRNGICDIPIAS